MAGDNYENKYEPLYDYLLKEKRADFLLTFEEIEQNSRFRSAAKRHARRMVGRGQA